MIGLTLLLAAAQAQLPGRAQRPVDRNYPIAVGRREAERTLQLYVDCLVTRRPMQPKIAEFLRTAPGSPDFNGRGMGLVDASCAPRSGAGYQMRMNPDLLRLVMFPALYARDYRKVSPPDLSVVPESDLAREFDPAPNEATVELRRFGDCVVRRDAADSRAVVLSKVYKSEEAAAFTALQPAMAQCISAGQQLRFSRSVLRGAIGEALYKMTVAAGAAKAG